MRNPKLPLLGVDELVVKGYVACSRCGDWAPEGSIQANRKLCDDCVLAKAAALPVEYVVEGKTFRHAPVDPNKPKKAAKRSKKRQQDSPGTKKPADLFATVRWRALNRLVAAHHEEYDLLFAAEKLKARREAAADDFATGPGYDPPDPPPSEP